MEECPLVQEAVAQYLYLTSQDRSNGGDRALAYLANLMDDLLDEKVAYEKFIIAKTYTEPTPPQTAAVVLEMRKNGALVRKGDIIQYVYACPQVKRPGEHATTPKEESFVRNSKGRYTVDVEPYIDTFQRQCMYHVDAADDILAKTRYKLERRKANLQDIAKFIKTGIAEDNSKTTPYAEIYFSVFPANQRWMYENIRILGNRLKCGPPKVVVDEEDGVRKFTYSVPLNDDGPQCMKNIIDQVEALYAWSSIAHPGIIGGWDICIVCSDGRRIYWDNTN